MTSAASALSDSGGSAPIPGLGIDTVTMRAATSAELISTLPSKRVRTMMDDETGELYDEQREGWWALVVRLSFD